MIPEQICLRTLQSSSKVGPRSKIATRDKPRLLINPRINLKAKTTKRSSTEKIRKSERGSCNRQRWVQFHLMCWRERNSSKQLIQRGTMQRSSSTLESMMVSIVPLRKGKKRWSNKQRTQVLEKKAFKRRWLNNRAKLKRPTGQRQQHHRIMEQVRTRGGVRVIMEIE